MESVRVAWLLAALMAGCAAQTTSVDSPHPFAKTNLQPFVDCTWAGPQVRSACNPWQPTASLRAQPAVDLPQDWFCAAYFKAANLPQWRLAWKTSPGDDGFGTRLGMWINTTGNPRPVEGQFVRWSATTPAVDRWTAPAGASFVEFPELVPESDIRFDLSLTAGALEGAPTPFNWTQTSKEHGDAYWTDAKARYFVEGFPPDEVSADVTWTVDHSGPTPRLWPTLAIPVAGTEVVARFPLDAKDMQSFSGFGDWVGYVGDDFRVDVRDGGLHVQAEVGQVMAGTGHRENFKDPLADNNCRCAANASTPAEGIECTLGIPPR